jgi:hypothetical protein
MQKQRGYRVGAVDNAFDSTLSCQSDLTVFLLGCFALVF